MSNLGKTVNNLRKEKGWSLNDLSTKSNIPVSTLHGIEKGSNPSFEKITRLAAALNVDVSLLIKDTNYTQLTNMNKKNKELYHEFLAPTKDYKEYIAAFEALGYEVYEHVGKYISGGNQDGFIYDIKVDNKVIITLDLDGFCTIGKMVTDYKRTFERSLDLLVKDTISNWDFIYGISEIENEEDKNNK